MNLSNVGAEQALTYVEKNESLLVDGEADSVEYILKFLTSRKHNWNIYLEKLMVKFIDYALAAKKYNSIKDGLKAFRSIAQSTAFTSLEEVLVHYKKSVEGLFEARREELGCSDKDLCELEDIELEETADELLEGTIDVFTKESRDEIRNSMKILWDAYKNIVETVRHNPRLEGSYSLTLDSMFQFVIKFNRRVEFKRFCDVMKNNFQQLLQKGKDARAVDLSREDQNNLSLQQRFKQLETALTLELWFDAFQILEDINQLMSFRTVATKKSTLMKYFYYLSLLFKKSNYSHYYAVSFYYHFDHFRKIEKKDNPEIPRKVDELVLAVISIFPENERLQSEENKAKIVSLITSANIIPSKKQLKQFVKDQGLLAQASESVRELWHFLESDFSLDDVSASTRMFEQVRARSQDHFVVLQKTVVLKLLQNISEVYSKIKLSKLFDLIPFENRTILEILLQEQSASLSFVIDQRRDLLVFRSPSSVPPTSAAALIRQAHATSLIAVQARRKSQLAERLSAYVADIQNILVARQSQAETYSRKVDELNLQIKKEAEQRKKEEELRKKAQQEAIEEEKRRREDERRLQNCRMEEKQTIYQQLKGLKNWKSLKFDGKKLEQLGTRQALGKVDLVQFKQFLADKKNELKKEEETRLKDAFARVDFIEREKKLRSRELLLKISSAKEESISAIIEFAKANFDKRKESQPTLTLAKDNIEAVLSRYEAQAQKKLEVQTADFKSRITEKYKADILKRAKELREAEIKRQTEERLLREERQRKDKEAREKSGITGDVAILRSSTTGAVQVAKESTLLSRGPGPALSKQVKKEGKDGKDGKVQLTRARAEEKVIQFSSEPIVFKKSAQN